MKKVLFACLQFILFLFVFAVGSFLPILSLFAPVLRHIPSVVTRFAGGTRGFEWDGVLMMLVLVVLILLIEAARKRIRYASPWTAAALAAATAVGLVIKLGFITPNS